MDRAGSHLGTIALGLVVLALLVIARPAAAGQTRPAADEPPGVGVSQPAPDAPRRHPAAEDLALSLLNCTRTGGLVRADGSCKGAGAGTYSPALPELVHHSVVSKRVAFRWASEIIAADVCDHVLPGRPVLDERFSTAGFRFSDIGENVGCGWGSSTPEAVVIATHRTMQAEKRTGGWHWRNMKDRSFIGVGIGVATHDGRTTIVYDFYGR
jgi:hypothetical protein